MKISVLLLMVSCNLAVVRGNRAEEQPGVFLPLPDQLIALNSPAGRSLLKESSSEVFLSLVQYYCTQPDLGSCGVASSVMVLNALQIPRPVSTEHGKFGLFTSKNFFTPAVAAIKAQQQVSSSGMSLDELAMILKTFSVDVKVAHASSSSVQVFRETMRSSLRLNSEFVLVNYLRKAIGQESGGHISPVGAFSERADKLLILDVSNYKYPWIWIDTGALFHAMESNDEASKFSRGYVIVSASKSQPDK